jgi:DNA gyrase subunit A
MGKYHPHGDQSIYDALVRMAQDFSMRLPLIDGQGNFGSIDGDPPAAMRYTEARLAKVAHEPARRHRQGHGRFPAELRRLRKEPTVLPARSRTCWSMARRHRRRHGDQHPAAQSGEVIDACDRADRQSGARPSTDLIEIMPGPDFPTGGIILGRRHPRRLSRPAAARS